MSVGWRAAADGVAHRHLAGGRATVCRAEPVDPRWAWPAVSRCPVCEVPMASLWRINDPTLPPACTEHPECAAYDREHVELVASISAGHVRPELRERVRQLADKATRLHPGETPKAPRR